MQGHAVNSGAGQESTSLSSLLPILPPSGRSQDKAELFSPVQFPSPHPGPEVLFPFTSHTRRFASDRGVWEGGFL